MKSIFESHACNAPQTQFSAHGKRLLLARGALYIESLYIESGTLAACAQLRMGGPLTGSRSGNSAVTSVLGRKTRSAFFTPILASAFFTPSLRLLYAFFYLAQNRGLRQNRWCGAARRSHLVVVRVWKFGSFPSLVFHARRATGPFPDKW